MEITGDLSLSSDSIYSTLMAKGLSLTGEKSTPDFEEFCVHVWAKPGAKKERVEVGPEGELILFIREKPIEGKANKAFVKTLSSIFGVPQGAIELVTGQKSKKKKFSLYFEFTKNRPISYYLEKVNRFIG
jgi:uncharacterized protein YggU (UPF0235/DUF167 family)